MKIKALVILLVFCMTFVFCAKKENTSLIEKSFFGKLNDGREVYKYILTNKNGCKVSIINFGAAVTSIVVPDKNGKFEDVVLGYDSLDGYVNDRAYFGVIVGRYGNRIGKGRFKLDGKDYQLTINDGKNHLHGGIKGFNKALWNAEILDSLKEASVAFTYSSPDGEEGYPGNVNIKVVYTLTNDNALRIDYYATTDRPTIINPTNHCYFNLTGSFENTILDHKLTIEADSFTVVDKELITTGKIATVDKTPLDFRTPTSIGERINDKHEQIMFGRGYDHNWVLRNYNKQVRKVAELYDPSSGRVMSVLTDQPGLQFYSGNFLDGTIRGKGGVYYKHRTGLCLETQCYPDSPNKPHFPSVVLRPGEEYRQTTIYQFSIK